MHMGESAECESACVSWCVSRVSDHVLGWHGGSTGSGEGHSPGNQAELELRMSFATCFVNLGKLCHL